VALVVSSEVCFFSDVDVPAVDELPDVSADATPCPMQTEAPIPRATANPLTRPTYTPAPMTTCIPSSRALVCGFDESVDIASRGSISTVTSLASVTQSQLQRWRLRRDGEPAVLKITSAAVSRRQSPGGGAVLLTGPWRGPSESSILLTTPSRFI
jgi:hypothetical protein